jgi:hypothetical protein
VTGRQVCDTYPATNTFCTFFFGSCNNGNCTSDGKIPDVDRDLYPATEDCNDDVFAINPSATENCSDLIDNDCDGLIDAADTEECGQCEAINCTSPAVPGPYPSCGCVNPSPILIDVAGNGFHLTDSASGITFDLNGDSKVERLGWTRTDSDDAWLALDHNSNGTIDNGTELFGNFTPQPASSTPNGFLALAEFDRAEQGGHKDGIIDGRDAVYSRLRLWQDTNHNGISEAAELHALPELGIGNIELDYKESKRTDEYGNQFRYRAKVKDARGAKVGRWAWDVFLVSGGKPQ